MTTIKVEVRTIMIIKIIPRILNQIDFTLGGSKTERNINLGAAQARGKWSLTLSTQKLERK